jgi:hypothetical protein
VSLLKSPARPPASGGRSKRLADNPPFWLAD